MIAVLKELHVYDIIKFSCSLIQSSLLIQIVSLVAFLCISSLLHSRICCLIIYITNGIIHHHHTCFAFRQALCTFIFKRCCMMGHIRYPYTKETWKKTFSTCDKCLELTFRFNPRSLPNNSHYIFMLYVSSKWKQILELVYSLAGCSHQQHVVRRSLSWPVRLNMQIGPLTLKSIQCHGQCR